MSRSGFIRLTTFLTGSGLFFIVIRDTLSKCKIGFTRWLLVRYVKLEQGFGKWSIENVCDRSVVQRLR